MLKEFVTDDTGGICGVKIQEGYQFPDENSGATRTIGVNRAVVLATGGFAMIANFD